MTDESTPTFLRESDDLRELRALEEIERNPHVSQRELANRLGVAVGIANACIHTLVRRGMVKIRGDNNRTLTYHLTKKGVGHKSSLAVHWTRNTIGFYRHARHMVAGELERLIESGRTALALYGGNELAEITLIVSSDFPEAEIVWIVRAEDDVPKSSLLGVPIVGLEETADVVADAVLLCGEPPPDALAILERVRDAAGETAAIHALFDKTV